MVEMSRIMDFAGKISESFSPDRIILFGSHAYGAASPDSDVDILVIMPFEGKGFRKSLEILNRTNPEFPVDLITRKPDDTDKRYKEGDPLIRDALDKGKVLYERHG